MSAGDGHAVAIDTDISFSNGNDYEQNSDGLIK